MITEEDEKEEKRQDEGSVGVKNVSPGPLTQQATAPGPASSTPALQPLVSDHGTCGVAQASYLGAPPGDDGVHHGVDH